MSNENEPGHAVQPRAPESRPPVDLSDPLTDLDTAFRFAQMLSQSSMVPPALRGSPQNCLVTMLLGRELGLSYIQAIRGIYVLPNGQPGLRGALLLARIRTAGHRYKFDRGDDYCTCIIYRKDEDFKVPYEGTFTVEDAKAAGLVSERDGKLVSRSRSGEPLPWEQYRRDMLQWRAVARAAGIGVPELVFGFDVAGIAEDSDGSGPDSEVPRGPQPPSRPPTAQEQAELREQLQALSSGTGRAQQLPPWEEELLRAHAAREDQAQDGPAIQTQLLERAGPPTGDETGADYDARPAVPSAQPAQPEQPAVASTRSLAAALGRCGHKGAKGARAAGVLVRRHVDHLSELTPGEILMARQRVDTITRQDLSDAGRYAALETMVAAEREAWEDSQPGEPG